MRKVKRYSKIIISCISLICVLAVSALSTYARADEPYYDNTFQLLVHGNVRSSVMLGTNVYYQSGWFKTGDKIFNNTETFRMVMYYSDAFKSVGLANNPSDDSKLYARLGVMESGLSGLTVEAGGILDIKFDWYYNIRVSEGIDNLSKGWSYGASNFPITGMTNETKMHFSSSARTNADGSHPWFAIDAVEVKNHGIYNGVPSGANTALYWSTVHFRFYNDTNQTLEFEEFVPYYDTVSGWKEPQYAETIKNQSGGVYPTSKDVGSILPSQTRDYIYMGYKANVLPSYKIVSAKGANNFETEQSIQNATDSIVDELDLLGSEITGSIDDLGDQIGDDISDLDTSINNGLDELGIGIAGGFNDLETSIDEDIRNSTNALKQELGDVDASINQGLDDLGNQIGEDLDEAVGDADIPDNQYDGNTNEVNGVNTQLDNSQKEEQELVDQALGSAENALKEHNLFDLTSITSGISSLSRTFGVITPAFNGFVSSLGGEFNVLLTYCIVGGIVLSICGLSGQVFMSNARSERAAARQSARMESRRSK